MAIYFTYTHLHSYPKFSEVGLPDKLNQYLKKKTNKQDQIRSYLAYCLLNKTLAEFTDESLDSLAFSNYGKPFLSDSSWEFSLSHSHNLIGLALSDQGKIGLDIQYKQQKIPDFSQLQGMPEMLVDSTPARFFDYWTLAESCAKADGRGVAGSQFCKIKVLDEHQLRDENYLWFYKKIHLYEDFSIHLCCISPIINLIHL